MKKDNPETEKIYINKQHATEKCRDLVTFDNIRKELYRLEKECEINSVKFQYLSGENFNRLLLEYLGDLECRDNGEKITVMSKSSTLNKTPSAVIVKPSPPISLKSSAAVGWRSSLPEYNLEIYNPLYISPKNTIVTLTPADDDIKHQKFIFLG